MISQAAMRRTALSLVLRHYAVEDAKRPIDVKVARAEFRAAASVLDHLNLAMTPDHVVLTILDAVREIGTERPAFRAVGNQARRDHDQAVADKFIDLMGWVLL